MRPLLKLDTQVLEILSVLHPSSSVQKEGMRRNIRDGDGDVASFPHYTCVARILLTPEAVGYDADRTMVKHETFDLAQESVRELPQSAGIVETEDWQFVYLGTGRYSVMSVRGFIDM